MTPNIKVSHLNRIYPSKVLLFGEYTVLLGSDALAMPFNRYSGHWEMGKQENFNDLTQFLSQSFKDSFNLDKWTESMTQNQYFKSNIPIGYGLGSSGSLVAAIYQDYFLKINEGENLEKLKETFSTIESFFHGRSSGFDPLVSYTNQAIFKKTNVLETIDYKSLPLKFLYLFDSKSDRNTLKLVNQFNQRLKDYDFKRVMNQMKKSVDKIIPSFLNNDDQWKSDFQELSQLQLKHLYTYIPPKIARLWKHGIDHKSYFFKLCGAGGGGFFLVHTEQNNGEIPLISLS